MKIIIPIQGLKKEKIPVSEVRIEIRKIEECFFGNIVNDSILNQLNSILEHSINTPFNLKIKAELIASKVKLIGYNKESKAVLDPNCNINYISKTRLKRK